MYSDVGYVLEATIRYLKALYGKHEDLSFLLKKTLINVKNSNEV